jgi:hypothetical protein
MIGVLGLSVDYLKAFKDVYDIIDPPSFHGKLPCALIQVKHGAALTPVEAQEPSAQLPKTLFFATVLELRVHVRIPLSHSRR